MFCCLNNQFPSVMIVFSFRPPFPAVPGFSERYLTNTNTNTSVVLRDLSELVAEGVLSTGDSPRLMAAKMINKKIEDVMEIKMPLDTELLYGGSQRFQREILQVGLYGHHVIVSCAACI